jgi:hypothetical protein
MLLSYMNTWLHPNILHISIVELAHHPKKKVSLWCQTRSAYQYDPWGERVVDMLRGPDGRVGVCNRAGLLGRGRGHQ